MLIKALAGPGRALVSPHKRGRFGLATVALDKLNLTWQPTIFQRDYFLALLWTADPDRVLPDRVVNDNR